MPSRAFAKNVAHITGKRLDLEVQIEDSKKHEAPSFDHSCRSFIEITQLLGQLGVHASLYLEASDNMAEGLSLIVQGNMAFR